MMSPAVPYIAIISITGVHRSQASKYWMCGLYRY